MNRLLIRGAWLLDPASGLDASGDLLVEGERIAAIGKLALVRKLWRRNGQSVPVFGRMVSALWLSRAGPCDPR
jgi:predicted amidohydrolase